MTGTAAVAAAQQVIRPSGVVIVGDSFAVPERHVDPSKGRGIVSFVTHSYDDTMGNVTQEKKDHWLAGDEDTRGWFARHGHPDMDEQFRVDQGQATFRFWEPDGDGGFDKHEVTLRVGGYILFPARVEHEGWNSGRELAVLTITGIRAGNTAPQDAGKGKNIPTV